MKSCSSVVMTFLLVIGCLYSTKAFYANRANLIAINSNANSYHMKSSNIVFKSSIMKNAIRIRGGSGTTIEAAYGRWIATAGVLAPISSALLSISSLPTILNIIKTKSVGQLPLLPYSSLVSNCFMWFCYGILKNEVKVWSHNGFSVVIGLYYFASFAKFSPTKSQTLQHVRATALAILASLVVAASMPRTKAASILGNVAVCVCIALYASPLVALQTVYRSKSAESIPLPFAIATTLSCILWSIVGIFDMKDVKIWFPCILGLGCGLLQIALKLIYRDGKIKTA